MTTKKKVPADVVALKAIVREQEAEISELKRKLEAAEKNATNYQSWHGSVGKEKQALESTLEEIHALIDACPGTLPRYTTVPKKNEWDSEKQRENGIMVRLASFMGARGGQRV